MNSFLTVLKGETYLFFDELNLIRFAFKNCQMKSKLFQIM
jgi:hypothetical protein